VSVKVAINATPDPVKAIREEVNDRKTVIRRPMSKAGVAVRPYCHSGAPAEGVGIEVVSIASVTISRIAAWTTISVQVSCTSLRMNRWPNRLLAAAEWRIACGKTA
jgi:hypothetical protein